MTISEFNNKILFDIVADITDICIHRDLERNPQFFFCKKHYAVQIIK